jgi:hypothetical protein
MNEALRFSTAFLDARLRGAVMPSSGRVIAR